MNAFFLVTWTENGNGNTLSNDNEESGTTENDTAAEESEYPSLLENRLPVSDLNSHTE